MKSVDRARLHESLDGDAKLTEELAHRVMGWKSAPGRFIKCGRRWTPRWHFQPLKNLKAAYELLEQASPQTFTIEGAEKRGFRVKVTIASVTGEASGQFKPRTITYAVACAVGIKIPVERDGRKNDGI